MKKLCRWLCLLIGLCLWSAPVWAANAAPFYTPRWGTGYGEMKILEGKTYESLCWLNTQQNNTGWLTYTQKAIEIKSGGITLNYWAGNVDYIFYEDRLVQIQFSLELKDQTDADRATQLMGAVIEKVMEELDAPSRISRLYDEGHFKLQDTGLKWAYVERAADENTVLHIFAEKRDYEDNLIIRTSWYEKQNPRNAQVLNEFLANFE